MPTTCASSCAAARILAIDPVPHPASRMRAPGGTGINLRWSGRPASAACRSRRSHSAALWIAYGREWLLADISGASRIHDLRREVGSLRSHYLSNFAMLLDRRLAARQMSRSGVISGTVNDEAASVM